MNQTRPAFRLEQDQLQASYGFVPGLNGLRAASILLVLFGHFLLPKQLAAVGATGVFLFFAISGFLITRLLFAEQKKSGSIDVPGFFFRRYLRLYPVLIVYISAFACLAAVKGKTVPFVEVASVFLYFTNYLENYHTIFGGQLVLPIGALWSLAVEEHFYLIMPFAFLLMKGSPRKVFWFSVAFTALPLLARIIYVTVWPDFISKEIVYRPSETRFDSIAIGVMLAALCELPKGRAFLSRIASPVGLIIGMSLLAVTFAYKGEIFGDTLRYTLRNFGCGFILLAIVCGRGLSFLQRPANWPVVDWIGRISYSLYIWQGCVKLLMHELVPARISLHGVEYILMSFILAAASFYFVEKPALQLKKLRQKVGIFALERSQAAASTS